MTDENTTHWYSDEEDTSDAWRETQEPIEGDYDYEPPNNNYETD